MSDNKVKPDGGHDWVVPSSSGLDRDDCAILGNLPADYAAITAGYFKEGSPVVIPTKLLNLLAERYPQDCLSLISVFSRQPPSAVYWSKQGKSLFLKWRIASDDGLYDDQVGLRFRAWKDHPGQYAAYEFFPNAEGVNPNSMWSKQLKAQAAGEQRNIAEDWDPDFDEFKGDMGIPFPPLGGKAAD